MKTTTKPTVTVGTTVNAPVEKVWKYFTAPEHIMKWNNPMEDWHTPKAENDLRVGGKFFSRMEAKDGSMGFDFRGVYDDVKTNRLIAYTIDDGRKVKNVFTSSGNATEVTVTFEGDPQDDKEKNGWQAMMDSLKKYTESN
jgi:uncharacterized protein YndB with AHSA1/START domain